MSSLETLKLHQFSTLAYRHMRADRPILHKKITFVLLNEDFFLCSMGSGEIISVVYCPRGFVRISNRPWGAFGWTKVWPLTVMAKAIINWKGGQTVPKNH